MFSILCIILYCRAECIWCMYLLTIRIAELRGTDGLMAKIKNYSVYYNDYY